MEKGDKYYKKGNQIGRLLVNVDEDVKFGGLSQKMPSHVLSASARFSSSEQFWTSEIYGPMGCDKIILQNFHLTYLLTVYFVSPVALAS